MNYLTLFILSILLKISFKNILFFCKAEKSYNKSGCYNVGLGKLVRGDWVFEAYQDCIAYKEELVG